MDIIEKQLVTYTQLYNNFNSIEIRELVKQIPICDAINYLSKIKMRARFNQHTGLSPDFNALMCWMMQTDEENKNVLREYLEKNKQRIDNIFLISKPATLLLVENLLVHGSLNNIREFNKEDYTNLFKAYTWCTEIITMDYMNYSRISKYSSSNEIISTTLPIEFRYKNIDYEKNIDVEFIKMFKFLLFSKNELKRKKEFDEFLQKNYLISWDEYAYRLITYLTNAEVKNNPLIKFADSKDPANNFMDKWCINNTTIDLKNEKDFNTLRKYPVIKSQDDIYCIIDSSLLWDKIYKGLLFEFTNNYPQFKGEIGKDFNEYILFYEAIRPLLNGYNILDGKVLESMGIKGASDFYARKGRKILLFEYKDITTSAEVRCSMDYNLIESKIYNEFWEYKGKSKGAQQLAKNIDMIFNGIYDKADRVLMDNICNIYPIIVYQDASYECSGVNYLVNEKFKKYHFAYPRLIRQIVMINIDSLIKLQDMFKNKKLQLLELIEEYIEFASKEQHNDLRPFDNFLFEKAYKLGYEGLFTAEFKECFDKLKTRKI